MIRPPRSTATRVAAPRGGRIFPWGGLAEKQPPRSTARLPWLWLALVLALIGVYVLGLDSFYAPTNGDEMVYVHIARMTAESGHWLPLQSELAGTRNTKPPLLFWQAMVAGNWGHTWSLFALRLPSIAYTFATTALLAFFAFRISGRIRTACLAAALYLLYFSTFRYGRVYLTSAPETFWLALPMFWLLWLKVRGQAPITPPPATTPSKTYIGVATYSLFGIAMGLGSAYKSFALVAPACAALWVAVLASEQHLSWPAVLRTTAGVTWSAILGIGIFALWFVLDPDPGSVWQEFVVAENAGKMSGQQGYWYAAFFGAYPMWTQLLAYPENSGFLFFAVVGLGWVALRVAFKPATYTQLTPAMRVLVVWLLVWLVIFTIPSQRSARYVIPAMPALAIVMAMAWEKIARPWFWITLAIAVPVLVMLARIGWAMGEMQIATPLATAMLLIAACAGIAGAAAGFFIKSWARSAALASCLAVYASFGLMVAPLSGPSAQYSDAVQARLGGARVAVPNGFTGQYERFNFLLPHSVRVPYDAEGRNTGAYQPELPPDQRLAYLLSEFDAVVWLQEDIRQESPSCTPQCQVIGARWHVKSRHKEGEITLANLWYPQQWLFGREWLIVKVP